MGTFRVVTVYTRKHLHHTDNTFRWKIDSDRTGFYSREATTHLTQQLSEIVVVLLWVWCLVEAHWSHVDTVL